MHVFGQQIVIYLNISIVTMVAISPTIDIILPAIPNTLSGKSSLGLDVRALISCMGRLGKEHCIIIDEKLSLMHK